MYALILFDQVHEIMADSNPAITIPFENWSPTPQFLFKIAEDIAPYITTGIGYSAEKQDFIQEDVLANVKQKHRALFTDAFAAIEYKAQRPQTTVLAAIMYDAPVPEPDADLVWVIESIKTENRKLLAALEAATEWRAAAAITPWFPDGFLI